VVGPVVEQEISHAFDDFWNAKVAYPGSAASNRATIEGFQQLRKENTEYLNEHRDLLSSYPLEPRDWSREMRQLPSLMKLGEAHFLQDDPVKFDGQEYRLVDMLEHLAERQHKELIITTPYLIPVKGFLEDLKQLSSEGVKVKIITASMASNNHTLAHSHYKKYRRRILATGAELYEFRAQPAAEIRDVSDVPPVQSKFISLHIKALVGDRKRCFIGSLNLDPRAIEINTENGLYIQSVALCGKIAQQFDNLMGPDNSWHVFVDENNYLTWKSSSGTVLSQPARSFWQRIADFFYRLLPIEKQL
jgi:putative cardiolipin synthase